MPARSKESRLISAISDLEDRPARAFAYLNSEYPIPTVSSHPAWQSLDASGHSYLLRTPPALNLPSIHLLIGPSCAGQDSLLSGMSAIGTPAATISTATSRTRRENEPEDAYLWMQAEHHPVNQLSETKRLMAAYGLIECQLYCGNYYGTPRAAIYKAASEQKDRPIVIKNDEEGAPAIRERLQDEFNTNIVALLPSSYEELWTRLVAGRNDPLSRLAHAALFMNRFPEIANYALFNHSNDDPAIGAQESAKALVGIISHANVAKGLNENTTA